MIVKRGEGGEMAGRPGLVNTHFFRLSWLDLDCGGGGEITGRAGPVYRPTQILSWADCDCREGEGGENTGQV